MGGKDRVFLCSAIDADRNFAAERAAAEWAKSEYPRWKDLVETAESWRYGIKMECQNETIGFIKFAVAKADLSDSGSS